MKKNFFGDIKEKILRANDPDEEYYNEEDYEDEYDEDETDEDDYSESSYSPSLEYDFGYDSSSSSTSTKKSYSSSNESKSTPNVNSKFAKKQGANIYQMNNSTTETRVSKVSTFILEESEFARNVADCMIKKDSVILLDVSRLSVEDANRVLNFLDGVRYICKSTVERIGKLHLIVPDTIEVTGDFFKNMSTEPFFKA